MGGTGTINTMIYMRGNPQDYDQWAADGNTGWSFNECLPYFKKLENVKSPLLASDSEFILKFDIFKQLKTLKEIALLLSQTDLVKQIMASTVHFLLICKG